MRTLNLSTVVSIALTLSCSSTPSSGGGSGGGSQSAAGGMTVVGSGGQTTSSGAPGSGGLTASGGTTAFGGATGSGGTTSSGGASAGTGNARGGATASGGATAGGGATASGGSAGTSASGGSGGGSDGTCTRDALQAATKSLADALTAKDSTKMNLDAKATYVENLKASSFTSGIWQSAVEIAFQRDFLDVDSCETFSEIIITEGTPYVLGVRLSLIFGKVAVVSALVSDSNDWQFDAANYLKVSKAEDWSVIAADQRDTRETLIAAGNAYFDLFNDKTVKVPWNTPCTRLEGGKLTTGSTCDVGVPSGITFADKHWVVDRDLGTAIGIVRFGGANGLPDSHMFRSLKGKIRYVHTITICDGSC